MKFKKWGAVVVAGALVAALGMFGCSSNNSSTEESTDDTAATEEASYTLVEEGKLIVGTSPDFPPFENMEDGEYVGFDMDLARALGEQLGLEVEFQTLNFDSIIAAVAAGGQVDVGISGFTVDPDRAEQVDFSTTYYTDNLSLAVMGGGGITEENAEEALNAEGVVIAVQSGTSGETYAREHFPNATITPFTQSTECFAAMQAGQATAVMTNTAVVTQMIEQSYPDAVIVLNAATGEDYAVAVSKDNPELLAAINDAIAALEEDGTIDELKTTWGV